MYSEEYLRQLESAAAFNRENDKEKWICPVCGREYKKWYWRSWCCGAELVTVERIDKKSEGKE